MHFQRLVYILKNAFDSNANHLCKSISPQKLHRFDLDFNLTLVLMFNLDIDM